MTTINASYKWTFDELFTSQQYHVKINGRTARWLRYGILAIVFGFIFWLYFFNNVLEWRILLLAFFLWLGLLINEVSRHPKTIERSLKKQYTQRKDQNAQIRFTIDSHNIYSITEGFGEGTIPWSDIYQIIETPTGFMIYRNKHVFIWLPFKALHNKKDIQRFRQMAQSFVTRYIEAIGSAG